MQNFTRKDLIRLVFEKHNAAVDDLIENLKFWAGKKGNKKVKPKPIISNGLKIIHSKSGLIYTVTGVGSSEGGDVFIKCEKPQGGLKIITSKNFSEYERL